MLFKLFLLISFTSNVLAVPQAPQITSQATADKWTSYSTVSATVTNLYTSNISTTSTALATHTRPFGPWHTSELTPPYDAAILYANKPDAPFHMLPFIAKDGILRLGGNDSSAYCPITINDFGQKENINYCERYNNVTAFYGCGLVSRKHIKSRELSLTSLRVCKCTRSSECLHDTRWSIQVQCSSQSWRRSS